MDPLRWRFKIQAYVEETANHASGKRFLVRHLEGQSRTGQPYPLNQIEIKGEDLGSNVRVVVSPHVTQVYFYVEDIPGIEGLENIVRNLGEVEQILNEVVIFAPDEIAKFSVETEIPVLSVSMLMTRERVVSECNKALDKLEGIVLNEISLAFISFTRGKIVHAKKRIEVILNELIKGQRGLIQMAKEQGIKGAKKWEEELDKMVSTSRCLETELASAQSPAEIDEILKRYWTIFKRH